ncbi:aldehyde dehydrogenase family protein [Microbulbifer sp. THAF38]|uniref:aldehyde dehydrogenase family protein n=1 Tax=Microbulbifer sp. THAF38 TaxID=2587856 RepID=UPI0012A7EC83|nr:aldehyde dehydrogenase family protein [Microbulbifer sp. THAF38]QFT54812.1 Sulfoacetaldehyde dehydrogenase [Microbulbifer sp. THAF38]
MKNVHDVIVIGAGPIRIAAAAQFLSRGLQPLVLEKGTSAGSAMLEWGHVRVFTPWSYMIDEVLKKVNDSTFGLQAGIFTRDLYRAPKAWDTLEVGGVVIGDVPSWRVDNMPYGGVKDSGLGREGVRWAIQDMTEERLMVVRTLR